jgi:hypothetical protein
VIRDSDLRGLFENMYIVHNIYQDERSITEADGNETKLDIINTTNVSIVTEILTESHPSKTFNVYVNDTKISQFRGIVQNGTYPIDINNVTVKNLKLNTSSFGLIYNDTYHSSSIKVILEDNESNSTNLFVQDPYISKFLNINIPKF